MLNNIAFAGTVVSNPVFKENDSGSKNAYFYVKSIRKSPTGKPHATVIRAVAFGSGADIANRLEKGDMVCLNGSLQSPPDDSDKLLEFSIIVANLFPIMTPEDMDALEAASG